MKPSPDLYTVALDLEPFFTEDWQAHVIPAGLRRDDGAQLVLRHQRGTRGRVHVSGHYPPGFAPPTEERTHITVALSRGAETIARDIQRRFLPPYLEHWADACREQASQAAALARQQAQLEELAAVLDVPVRDYGSGPWLDWRYGTAVADIRVRSEAHLKLQFLPYEVALAICQVLRDYRLRQATGIIAMP